MSMDGNRPDEGPEDSALIGGDLFGDGSTDDGHQEGQEQGRGGGEGSEPEPERQGQARGDDGRFARSEDTQGRQDQRQGDDRAQRGLRAEVTGERGRRQAAETQLEAERRERENDRRELARLQGVVEQMQRSQPQQRQAEPPKPEPAPDRYTDPEGYDRWMRATILQEARAENVRAAEQRAEYSLQDAQRRDPQAFDAAYQALRSADPQTNAQLRQQMLMVPDAGAFLVNWHRQALARQEIGADPDAYRQRVRAELAADIPTLMQDPATRQAILDHLRAQAGQGGANGGPRTTYDPTLRSLNGARGSNTVRGDNNDGSDAGIWESTRG